MKAASAHPATIGQALRTGGGNPAQALLRPAPPQVAAILPSMVSKEDLAARISQQQHLFTGPDAAETMSQFLLDYLDIKLAESRGEAPPPARSPATPADAAMTDPDVEFEDSSDGEGEATSSAARPKKTYKMKQSERDARVAKKQRVRSEHTNK